MAGYIGTATAHALICLFTEDLEDSLNTEDSKLKWVRGRRKNLRIAITELRAITVPEPESDDGDLKHYRARPGWRYGDKP